MSYTVDLAKHAQRNLSRAPEEIRRAVYSVLEQLEHDPRPRNSFMLRGKKPHGWKIRIDKYRLLYSIDDAAELVHVYDIDLRDSVYKQR